MNLKEFFKSCNFDISNGLILVYGKAGVGKTTFLMELARETDGRAFILDSENNFSIDRFKQICGSEVELDSLMISKPTDFDDQARIVSNVVSNDKLFDFIGVDTVGKHYRTASKKGYKISNNEIARQMRVLKEISRNKLVVVCNQVFQNIREDKVEPLGKNYVTKWCDVVVELDEVNEVRKFKLIKPETVEKDFKLNDKGFIFS